MKIYKAFAAKDYNNVSRHRFLENIESIEHRPMFDVLLKNMSTKLNGYLNMLTNYFSNRLSTDLTGGLNNDERFKGSDIYPSDGYFFDFERNGNEAKRTVLETIEVNVPDLFPFNPINDEIKKVSIKNGSVNTDCSSASIVNVSNSVEVRVARGTLLPRNIKKGDRFLLIIDDDMDWDDAILVLF